MALFDSRFCAIFGTRFIATGSGTSTSPSFSMNAGNLMMTRNAWPIGPAAICGVETSSDGGATWAPAGSFTVDGGEVLGKDGSPVTVNRFHFSSAPGAISRYWVTPLANIETSISVSGV